MNQKFMRYKKIVFTPKVEFPEVSTETNVDSSLMDFYDYYDPYSDRIRVPSETRITLSDHDWTWTMKMVPTEKYRKVAEIVGHDLAERVLTALGEK